MPFDPQDCTFLLPGPVKVHPRVLAAMAQPAVAHRGPEFTQVNERLFERARDLMGTPHVAILAGSGTTGMEAAVSNLVHWGDHAVGLDAGKFGARMADLVERYAGPEAVRLEVPWGRPVDLEVLGAALEAGAGAVALTLNETSTAVMHDGAAIGRLCRKHDALLIADTITATGSVPVPFDEWGLDASIVGSQKCIGAPPGLALVGLSDRAVERLDAPTISLDLAACLRKAEGGQTPFTPAVPLHLACLEALDMLFAEGLQERYARTAALAAACRDAGAAAGLDLPADADHRSDTVTAVSYPAGVDDAVRARLKEHHGVIVAGAQGPWKGKVLRIGHMGQVTWPELAAGWAALCVELEGAGHRVDKGAVMDALAAHAPGR